MFQSLARNLTILLSHAIKSNISFWSQRLDIGEDIEIKTY